MSLLGVRFLGCWFLGSMISGRYCHLSKIFKVFDARLFESRHQLGFPKCRVPNFLMSQVFLVCFSILVSPNIGIIGFGGLDTSANPRNSNGIYCSWEVVC